MEQLSKAELELLLSKRGSGPCISLFMPTQRGREKARENMIRFKGLLSGVEQQLEARGVDSQERKSLLEPARKLLDESIFWSAQSEGLAVYLARGFSCYYRLPLRFQEQYVVRNSFHLKPLFALLTSDGQYHLLALSQKDARLLRGTRGLVEEMDISHLVKKFEEEFGDELPEKFLQFHTKTPVRGEARTAIYYGHGGDIENVQKEKMLKYFRFIDRELRAMFSDNDSPLILACVDFLLPLYREASKYPLLMESGIKGNPENLSAQELHSRAWAIVEPFFQEKEEAIKALYHELKGTGKTSNNINEIVPAAYHGRIGTIFVTPGVHQWGCYDLEKETVVLSEEAHPGSEDLIDLAAAETFLNSGAVYALETERMPDISPAAIFRW